MTCTFTLDVPGIGVLEGGSEPDVSRGLGASCLCKAHVATPPQIKTQAKAELPFWLARTLTTQ